MNWKTLLLAGALSAISPTSNSNQLAGDSWTSSVVSGTLVNVNVYSRWDNQYVSSGRFTSYSEDLQNPWVVKKVHWVNCPEWVQIGSSIKQDLLVDANRAVINAILYCRNNLGVSHSWRKVIEQVSPAWIANAWQIHKWRQSNWWTYSMKANHVTFAASQIVRVLFSDGKGKHEVICTNPQEVPIVWATFNVFRQNIEVKRWWTDVNFWTNYAVNVLLNCNFN